MSVENGTPSPDGRWRHEDGSFATDEEAAAAIWGTPGVQRVRKLPVEVEAWLVSDDQDDNDALLEWLGDAARLDDDADIEIETLEGIMTARTGDWIIKGVNGEFYPCKPDIFAKTYEVLS